MARIPPEPPTIAPTGLARYRPDRGTRCPRPTTGPRRAPTAPRSLSAPIRPLSAPYPLGGVRSDRRGSGGMLR